MSVVTSTSRKIRSISRSQRSPTAHLRSPDSNNAVSSTNGRSLSTVFISRLKGARSLLATGRPWSTVPESNANNGVGRLDVELAAAEGCMVGLGTDGMSSAMLRALRAAFLASELAEKTRQSDSRLTPLCSATTRSLRVDS